MLKTLDVREYRCNFSSINFMEPLINPSKLLYNKLKKYICRISNEASSLLGTSEI